MALGVIERKRYVERNGCEQATADSVRPNNPLICIDPSGRMYSNNSTTNLHPETDILVMLDPTKVVHQSEKGDNQYAIIYNNGIQYQIPRPLATPNPVSEVENGETSASLESLFEISEEMMQLILRTRPRQSGLG
ncbi:MAG: hypothetical protein KJ718_03995 [Nanoarchaeota archaeon]|nr:hypothetical protein [Nanoarchaeota archaeon]MBU1051690.1 hypothetical protein [Nanoarchaeota archaeon]MBU1988867.1 hypothetical protein [Nanoarchaeota archaeon]